MSVEARKAQLEARLADLNARMAKIDGELDSYQSKDWEEAATEREEEEVLENMGHSARAELRMIHAAIDRIAEGEYGYCAKCGDEIADERLDLLPYTPFCHKCAS